MAVLQPQASIIFYHLFEELRIAIQPRHFQASLRSASLASKISNDAISNLDLQIKWKLQQW